jgi:hypothetical protein
MAATIVMKDGSGNSARIRKRRRNESRWSRSKARDREAWYGWTQSSEIL